MTDPDLPSITLSSLSGPNGTTADLTVGEEIISTDGGVAIVAEIINSTKIGIAYLNDTKFNIGDIATFQSSSIQGTVTAFTVGDRLVSSKYEVDNGQRTSFYDYARIIRIGNEPAPTRRLKIVYRYYVVPSTDEGDIFSINSYDAARYDDDISYLSLIHI